MRWLASKRLRTVLAATGIAFLAFALRREGIPVEDLTQIGWMRLAVSLLILGAAVTAAAWSWSILMGKGFADTGMTYLRALPAKYIPGGMGLPVVQLSFEMSQGDKAGAVVVRLAQHFLVSLGAGGLVSLLLQLVASDARTPLAFIAALVLGLSLIAALPRLAHRALSLFRQEAHEPARTKAVGAALVITSVALFLMGISYTVILDGLSGTNGWEAPTAAFTLSWAVGHAAVPVPAGIGLREAALLGSLPALSPSPVIVASLLHRLLAIGAELLVTLAVRLWPRQRAFKAPPHSPVP